MKLSILKSTCVDAVVNLFAPLIRNATPWHAPSHDGAWHAPSWNAPSRDAPKGSTWDASSWDER